MWLYMAWKIRLKNRHLYWGKILMILGLLMTSVDSRIVLLAQYGELVWNIVLTGKLKWRYLLIENLFQNAVKQRSLKWWKAFCLLCIVRTVVFGKWIGRRGANEWPARFVEVSEIKNLCHLVWILRRFTELCEKTHWTGSVLLYGGERPIFSIVNKITRKY